MKKITEAFHWLDDMLANDAPPVTWRNRTDPKSPHDALYDIRVIKRFLISAAKASKKRGEHNTSYLGFAARAAGVERYLTALVVDEADDDLEEE